MHEGVKLPDASDRRRHQRFDLKVFGSLNSCTIALDPGAFLDCTLLDLSQGGLRIAINSDRKGLPLPSAGQGIEFRSFLNPKNRGLEGLRGQVAWVAAESREIGVSFDAPLPPERVAELLHKN
jgi:hypothetical protein